jgi:hypothetical protein
MSERAHMLEAPLRELKFGHSMQNWTREAMDRSVFEQIHVGDGAPELVGRVRYDRNAQSLIDLIVAGSQGKTLTYIPDLDDPDVKFDCDLVAPKTPTALQLDAQRGVLGDQSVELILRETTQGAFDPLIKGTAVLFAYSAGGSLREATFTRSSGATHTGKGFGTIVASSSNEARLDWNSTAGSTGFRNIPTLLLEASRTNFVIESEDMSTGNWVPVSTSRITQTSAQDDPTSTGTNAWLIATATSVGLQFVTHTCATSGSTGNIAVSIFFKATTDTGTPTVLVEDGDAAGIVKFDTAFSSGEPTVSVSIGSTGEIITERYEDEYWRVGAASATGSTDAAYTYKILPAQANTTGSVIAFGAQLEQ